MSFFVADCEHGLKSDECPKCMWPQLLAKHRAWEEVVIERDAARRDLKALRTLLRECNVTCDMERETVSLGGVIVGPNRSENKDAKTP